MTAEPLELSLVLPAYNEVVRLPPSLELIRRHLDAAGRPYEVLVVDDGSEDGTREMVEQVRSGWPQLQLIVFDQNLGKGAAVRAGMLQSVGQLRLFSDADLSTPIEELEKLWDQAAREGARCAIGSRALDRSLIGTHQPAFRENMGRVFNLLMRLETGLPFRDTQCGFKLFETAAAREIFSRQRINGFGFDVEVLYIAKHLGYRTLEVPVRWNDVAGTKVSMMLGAMGFLDPLKVRWDGLTGKYR